MGQEVLATFGPFTRHNGGNQTDTGDGVFGGLNVTIDELGGVRARAGISAISMTAAPSGTIGSLFPVLSGLFGFTIGTSLKIWSASGGAVLATTALGATPSGSNWGWSSYETGALLTIRANTTYQIGIGGAAALAGAPGGSQVAVLGDRIWVSDMTANANRIQYSDAANSGSWTATNFLDFGLSTSAQIHFMKRQRNSLLVGAITGTGLSLHRVSGIGPTLRSDPVMAAAPYFGLAAAASGYGDRVWAYTTTDTTYPVFAYVDADTPQIIGNFRYGFEANNYNSGGQAGSQFGATTAYQLAPQLDAPQAILYAVNTSATSTYDNRFIFWSRGRYYPMMLAINDVIWITAVGSGQYVMAKSGSGTVSFYLLVMNDALDTGPAQVTDAGTTIPASLYTPIKSAEAGSWAQVQTVVVDFRHLAAANIEPFIDSYRAGDNFTVSSVAGAPTTYTGSPGTAGEWHREVFTFGTQDVGTAFRVRLEGLKGASIDKITVLGERFPSQL